MGEMDEMSEMSEMGQRRHRPDRCGDSHATMDIDDQLLFDVIHRYERKRFGTAEHTGAVRLLLARRDVDDLARLMRVKDARGHSALYYAVMYHQTDVSRLLIEAGADACDPEHDSPLELAIREDDALLPASTISFAKWLCDTLARQGRRDAMARIFNAQRLLIVTYAGAAPRDEITRILLDHGADPNQTNWGRTLLGMAAKRGHTQLAQLLIDHGANVNCVDSDEMTPLHYAALHGHAHMVILLLRAGASDLYRSASTMGGAHSMANLTPSKVAFLMSHYDIGKTIRDWNLWHPHPGSVFSSSSSSSCASSSSSDVPCSSCHLASASAAAQPPQPTSHHPHTPTERGSALPCDGRCP